MCHATSILAYVLGLYISFDFLAASSSPRGQVMHANVIGDHFTLQAKLQKAFTQLCWGWAFPTLASFHPALSLKLTLLLLLLAPPSASNTSFGKSSSGINSILNQFGWSILH